MAAPFPQAVVVEVKGMNRNTNRHTIKKLCQSAIEMGGAASGERVLHVDYDNGSQTVGF